MEGEEEGEGWDGWGGGDRERLFVWLSTLCERGGGEEKRAGNTLENGCVGCGCGCGCGGPD